MWSLSTRLNTCSCPNGIVNSLDSFPSLQCTMIVIDDRYYVWSLAPSSDHLHLPILRPPSYYSGLRSTRGKLRVHSIKSRAHNIGFSSSITITTACSGGCCWIMLFGRLGWVGLVYARPRSTVHWSLLSRRCCCISPHNLSCVCVPGRSLLLQLWAPIIILCSTSSDRTWLYRCTAAAVDDSLLLLLLHRIIIIITRDTPEEICCFRMDRSGFV